LANIPDPQWLVEGVLMQHSLAGLYGETGLGKSFGVLDIGLCVQTGLPWHGRATAQGPVVYAAGEGLPGMKFRVQAWKVARGFDKKTGIRFSDRIVNLLNPPAVIAFSEAIAPVKPVLVIIDTLARAMVGGDEDSAKDMGIAIAALARLSRELDATMLLVHHPAKKDARVERGSGALRGGVDTLLWLKKDSDQLTLVCEKQKDAEPFEDIHLRREVIDLGNGRSSCVIELADKPSDTKQAGRLSGRLQHLLTCLREQPDQQARFGAWRDASGVPGSSFNRFLSPLLDDGYVEKVPGLPGQTVYKLTEKGLTATANSLPRQSHGSDQIATATTPTPLLRGVGGSSGSDNERSELDFLGTDPLPEGTPLNQLPQED
jgi:hypothetical protein